MADEKKYLEGNYDGEPVQQAVQMAADVVRAVNMPKEIRAVQEDLSNKEIGRVFNEEKVTDERFEELMRNYIKEDKYHQYLVDGAVLRCTAATTDDFTYAEEETVVLENKDDEVCNITLDVHENPMNINGLTYATIKDTIQNVNIVAPKCNCCLVADRDAERNSIKNDTDRNKNGVCMHLMRLNEEWDNFEVDGTTYLTKTNIAQSPFTAGVGKILDVVIEESEGITMTSVLFCKHGGLIMPVTSGQCSNDRVEDELEQYKNDVRYQRLLIETERRKGRIEEYKIEFVLEVFPKILVDEARSGIPAEITFGQICLESSYGRKTCVDINTGINGNNYFGIKGKGPAGSVSCNTKEEVSGNKVPIVDDFRAYNSMDESIQDHSDLLVKDYQQYITTGSIEDWCDALNIGGYATASNYKEQILGVCRTWDIIQ